MFIDLDNQGQWYQFGEDSDASVCLRLCSLDVLSDIDKKTAVEKVEYRINDKTRQMERIVYSHTKDPNLRNELYWDYIIVDFKGFKNKSSGEEIACTKENKILLMGRSPQFARFVVDKIEEMSNAANVRDEEIRKN